MRAKSVLILFVVLILALVTATPVAAAPEACPCWHYVVRGETLFSIGRLYNVSPWAIASANGLANPNCIYAGQKLYIPAGPPYYGGGCYTPGCGGGCGWYYTVRCGDTLLSIARAHGVNAWAIARANGIYNMNHIWTGQRLLIPGC